MLELRNIKKDYPSGDATVHALKGVSVQFRDSEFVAILGQSGCGKTTLLNIIGGLDHYSSGDLVINGTSTKEYKDADWDSYRNHSVGFVFQSYNLIPHQSVLSNVELALTLSGVSKAERRIRATRALEQVGLGDQLHKKPNQMSGGQMQRVAIARALVNDPSIVLADEPTGALDSETSVQVMEILKEVAKDRLVVMVTHNPDLAHEYASRIVQLKDGELLGDSNPFTPTAEDRAACAGRDANAKRTSMSLATAFSLSLNNLMTKKGRTILTAFAGSIGIIGIALILSLSSGAQDYITNMEESTMGSYPLTIQSSSMDMATMMTAMSGMHDEATSENGSDQVEAKDVITGIITSMANDTNKNDMEAAKKWLDSNPDNLQDYVTDIQYSYKTPLNVYAADTSDGVVQVNPSTILNSMGVSTSGAMQSEVLTSMSAMGSGYDVWMQMLNNPDAVYRDYEVVKGEMPQAWNEVVICLDKSDRISDYTLYSLGMRDQSELEDMMTDALAGKEIEAPDFDSYSYDELLGMEFKVLPESAKYEKDSMGLWTNMSEDSTFMADAVDAAETLKVVGVVRPTEDNNNQTTTMYGGVLYRSDLMEYVIDQVNDSDVVAAQKADAETDIFTGYPFESDEDEPLTMASIQAMMEKMPEAQAQQIQGYLMQMQAAGMTEDEIVAAFEKQKAQQAENSTYEGNLEKLGVADMANPFTISLYPRDFEAKEQVDQIIANHNSAMEDAGKDAEVIQYTDIVGAMMSSVTSIVNSITYILVAFVAISLVVSSIMIGIITYISVLERTKEIGILRSIGASKKDVSRVFNAETFIIGLVAGVLGIGVTALLNIPINMVIEAVAGVANMASVPVGAGGILILISVLLTLIGGLIPAKMAAKKDPVTALRTE